MKKYTVLIEQILVGYVEIEAETEQEAEEIADNRFGVNGETLPPMDDIYDLEFRVVDVKD